MEVWNISEGMPSLVVRIMLSILSFLGWGWGGGTRHLELDAVRERGRK
jgi:hypothetical protein